jgi:hypothetical protein
MNPLFVLLVSPILTLAPKKSGGAQPAQPAGTLPEYTYVGQFQNQPSSAAKELAKACGRQGAIGIVMGLLFLR